MKKVQNNLHQKLLAAGFSCLFIGVVLANFFAHHQTLQVVGLFLLLLAGMFFGKVISMRMDRKK